MGFYYSDEQLAHHGIKGQRWGVRRFQNRDGTRTAAGKAREREQENSEETNTQTENNTRKGFSLTPSQKKALIIGASVTAGIVAGYGAYKLYENYKYKDAKYDPASHLKLKDREYSADEDMASVNNGRYYKAWNDFFGNYRKNCMLCTTTYDLRRRGYDVKAGECKTGKLIDHLKNVYDISDEEYEQKLHRFKGDETIESVAKQFGPGARGNLIIPGHSIAWENDENGETWIRDCQINLKAKLGRDASKVNGTYANSYRRVVEFEPVAMIRTDDLPIKASAVGGEIRDWSRNTNDNPFGESDIRALLRTTAKASVAGLLAGYATGTIDANIELEKEKNNANEGRSDSDNSEKTSEGRKNN